MMVKASRLDDKIEKLGVKLESWEKIHVHLPINQNVQANPPTAGNHASKP